MIRDFAHVQIETFAQRVTQTAKLAAQGIKANFPDGRNRVCLKDQNI
jgi:hypothetical protein